MTISETELLTLLESWFWPFIRIGALLMASPVVGTRAVPVRIRLVMAMAITMVVVPALPPLPLIDPLSAEGMLTTLQQVLIGVALGLTVRLMFVVFELSGQIIGQQMGLGFAAMVDPSTGTQVPVVSQFYIVIGTLSFLALNGHLILIKVVVESFTSMPVGAEGIDRDGIELLLSYVSWLIANAVLLALPAIVALMVVNLSFGVMTRAAPQLNIFAVGFPIMILMGSAIMLMTLSGLEPHLVRLLDEALNMSRQLVISP